MVRRSPCSPRYPCHIPSPASHSLRSRSDSGTRTPDWCSEKTNLKPPWMPPSRHLLCPSGCRGPWWLSQGLFWHTKKPRKINLTPLWSWPRRRQPYTQSPFRQSQYCSLEGKRCYASPQIAYPCPSPWRTLLNPKTKFKNVEQYYTTLNNTMLHLSFPLLIKCVYKHYTKDASHSIRTRERLWSGPLRPRYKTKVAGRCHKILVTPTFGHPRWLILQWILKFWSHGWAYYREIGHPWWPISMGEWSPHIRSITFTCIKTVLWHSSQPNVSYIHPTLHIRSITSRHSSYMHKNSSVTFKPTKYVWYIIVQKANMAILWCEDTKNSS